jgi:hypothetical protein
VFDTEKTHYYIIIWMTTQWKVKVTDEINNLTFKTLWYDEQNIPYSNIPPSTYLPYFMAPYHLTEELDSGDLVVNDCVKNLRV